MYVKTTNNQVYYLTMSLIQAAAKPITISIFPNVAKVFNHERDLNNPSAKSTNSLSWCAPSFCNVWYANCAKYFQVQNLLILNYYSAKFGSQLLQANLRKRVASMEKITRKNMMTRRAMMRSHTLTTLQSRKSKADFSRPCNARTPCQGPARHHGANYQSRMHPGAQLALG